MQAYMVQCIVVTNATYRSKETQRWRALRREVNFIQRKEDPKTNSSFESIRCSQMLTRAVRAPRLD